MVTARKLQNLDLMDLLVDNIYAVKQHDITFFYIHFICIYISHNFLSLEFYIFGYKEIYFSTFNNLVLFLIFFWVNWLLLFDGFNIRLKAILKFLLHRGYRMGFNVEFRYPHLNKNNFLYMIKVQKIS